jgi:hypothetical protein
METPWSADWFFPFKSNIIKPVRCRVQGRGWTPSNQFNNQAFGRGCQWKEYAVVGFSRRDKDAQVMKSKLAYQPTVKWYISYEILTFDYEDTSLQGEYLVWENLILIRADDPDKAYAKAIEHGKSSEDEVTINEKTGFCKFKGIKKLVPVYEELEDGAEIEWREYELPPDELKALIPIKEELQAFHALTNFDDPVAIKNS